MLTTGDLVEIKSLGLRHFADRLAIVQSVALAAKDEKGQPIAWPTRSGYYYLVMVIGGESSHVFHEDNLKVISTAGKKHNE